MEALEARLQALEAQLAAETAARAASKTEAAARLALPPPPSPHLDVREPPFSKHDWTWLNGSNYQPASLLRIGPVTPTFFVDAFYAWQFHKPVDHTIFQTTTAPRHNELSINLAYAGFELNGIDTRYGGPIGRFEAQFGASTETNQGQDLTTTRGFYLSNRAFNFIKQAAAGWHFHWLHGVNIEVGIFPSYVALESYVPQENWNYTHPFVSDFTPYYFAGSRTQIFFKENLKLELWLVNGWQTLGQWHEGRAGGYLVNWRPNSRWSFTHSLYVGQELAFNGDSLRSYTDNYVQFLAYSNLRRSLFQRLAFCLVADLGYEYRGGKAGQPVMDVPTPPNGIMTGFSLTGRAEWTRQWMTTLRGDLFYDHSAALVTGLPVVASGANAAGSMGNPYALPGNGDASNPFMWLGGGFAVTVDWRPSPWLLARLEYAHRIANQPYFSGAGGITGPGGVPPATEADRMNFRPDLRTTDDRIIANLTLRM